MMVELRREVMNPQNVLVIKCPVFHPIRPLTAMYSSCIYPVPNLTSVYPCLSGVSTQMSETAISA